MCFTHCKVYDKSWSFFQENSENQILLVIISIHKSNVIQSLKGYQLESEGLRSRHTYVVDLNQKTWREVGNLHVPRYGHSCGKFTLNNGTEVIIVAGGQTGTNMASKIRHIEVFDIQVRYKKIFALLENSIWFVK